MPSKKDNPDAPVKRSFLSRALSGGGGGSKEARRKSVVGIEGIARNGGSTSADADRSARRLSGIAPLPPSLASTDAAPPLPSSTTSSSLSAAQRPGVTRSTSSFSVSASSVASTSSSAFSTTPKRDREKRRISLYDPNNPVFPSPPRSPARSREASVASTASASSMRPKSLHSSGSTSSLRPVSNVFPSRPSSIHSSGNIPSRSSSRYAFSSSPPPPVPTFVPSTHPSAAATAATYIDYTAVSSSSSAASLNSSNLAGADDDPFALPSGGTGTAQMDELVAGMRRRSGGGRSSGRRTREGSVQSGKGKERAEYAGGEEDAGARRTRRQHRREDSSALSDWSAVAVSQPVDEDDLFPPRASFEDADITGAPSMERQETLKALERPWMQGLVSNGGAGKRGSVALPAGAGGAKTVEDLVGQYRGQLREAAVGSGRRKSMAAPSGSEVNGREEERAGEPPPFPPNLVLPAEEPQNTLPQAPKPLAYVPLPAGSLPPSLTLSTPGTNGEPPTPTRIKTIEEIIAEHAGSAYLAKRKPSASAPPPSTDPPSSSSPPPAAVAGDAARPPRERDESVQTLSSLGTKSSIDSLGEEIRLAAQAGERYASNGASGASEAVETPRSLQHSRSFSPSSLATSQPQQPYAGMPASPSIGSINGAMVSSAVDALVNDDFDTRSARSRTPSTPRVQSPKPYAHSDLDVPSPSSASSSERDLALLLKSPRLTRLITLRNAPNAGLTVSLADVGSPTGHPVLVFLGLGSVRYLIALYDEVADTYGLRLICVDRWGLGRTGSVPDSQRGFTEWASVVEELVSPSCLDLPRFSILAHSAGAPYAVASSIRPALSPKIAGSLHLLAPWVSTPGVSGTDSLAGPYRFLKYVPTGVLKTAQAAEWKVQAWRLGKPPQVAPGKAVGYDAKAGRLFSPAPGGGEVEVELDEAELEAERERWAAEAPVEGISAPFSPPNGTGAAKLAELYGAEAGFVPAGPANGSSNSSSGGSGKKGWKLLGGRKSSPASDEGGLTRSPSSLRPPSILSKRSSFHGGDSNSAASSRTLAPSGLPMPLRRSSVISVRSGSPAPTTPTRSDSLSSFSSAMSGAGGVPPRSPTPTSANGSHAPLLSPSSTLSASTSNASLSPRHRVNSGGLSPISRSPSPSPLSASPSSIPSHILIDGLLRASHAESLRGGGTADLLVLLDSAKKGLGFEYRDLDCPVKVWYGDKDDRISAGSIRWLEREVKERGRKGVCEVKVVEGADHGLMANGRVMLDVLESIAADWDRPPLAGRSSSSATAKAAS
ncbi:hypothetical protein JCM6882_007323 [Rhodosporidiobolus microsporus]